MTDKQRLQLTPELVVQSFKNTGLKPIVQGFGDGKTCGCLMTTIVKEHDPESITYQTDGNLNSNNVYEAYGRLTGSAKGILSGYDTPNIQVSDGDSPQFIANHEFGKACRQLLEALGMLP